MIINESPVFSIQNHRFNVILLAAGLGSRLRPETDFIPKALVQLGAERAIDFSIRKYHYVADRIIIATGYCADLLENYVRGKYPTLTCFFSRESVSELRGPGLSLLYALDYASSRLPTIISFCDYIIVEPFAVDHNALGLCTPDPTHASYAVLGTYRTLGVVDEGLVNDIVPNADMENVRDCGFTGISVLHNTVLLKSIAYTASVTKLSSGGDSIDFTMDVIREYVRRVPVQAVGLTHLLEFGTEETLKTLRGWLSADR